MLAGLPIALLYRAGVHVYAGEFAAADAVIEEADAITEATGSTPLAFSALMVPPTAAGRPPRWSGSRPACGRDGGNEGRTVTLAEYAKAVLLNGLGRYPEAHAAARRAGRARRPGPARLVPDRARGERRPRRRPRGGRRRARAAEASAAPAGATGRSASRPARARSSARATTPRPSTARRSSGSPAPASSSTSPAPSSSTGSGSAASTAASTRASSSARPTTCSPAIGAEAFAERARRELLATGETARRRTIGTRDELTAQEAQIARLAREGRTNPEIGAQLFISPRTVEWHLRHVFTKLDISSRKELRRALPDVTSV